MASCCSSHLLHLAVLVMALTFLLGCSSVSSFGRIRVWVHNNISMNTDMTIHCRSKDDDLGEHNIPYNGNITWKFHERFDLVTLFWCRIGYWDYKAGKLVQGSCDIYKSTRDDLDCKFNCIRYVKTDGIYFYMSKLLDICRNPNPRTIPVQFSGDSLTMRRHRSGKEDANLRPSFPGKSGFKFFKIIHSANIKQLGFPKKFVKKFSKYLADGVLLRVANAKTWNVELRKADGEVWLSKGWVEFVEYYSICVGQFLAFRYDGSSHFHVLIFDMSGTEILYPCNANINHQDPSGSKGFHVVSQNLMDETDVDDSVEMFGVSHPNEYDIHSKQHKNVDVAINISPSLSQRKGVFSVPEKTERAIESAKAFKSEHPFYVLVLRPSYVNRGYAVIPPEFVTKYMPEKCTSLKLKVSNAKTWPVTYLFRQRASRCILSKGWLTFVRENKLKLGDVCVFELINKVDIAMKVSIFRVAEILFSEIGKCFFKVYLRNLSFKRLRIPRTFLTHMQAETSETFTLTGPSGRVWNVNLIEDGDGFFLEEGWPVFVRDHNIEIGDFLVFRKDENSKFAVDIYDSSECEKESTYHAICSQDTTYSIKDEGQKRGIRDEVVKVLNDSAHKSCEGLSKRKRGSEATVPCVSLRSAPKSTSRNRTCEKNELAVNSKCLAVIKAPNLEDSVYRNGRTTQHMSKKDSEQHQFQTATKYVSNNGNRCCDPLLRRRANFLSMEGVKAKAESRPGSLISQRRNVTEEERERALGAAMAFESKNPYTIMVMWPSYVYYGFHLPFPTSFSKPHLPKDSTEMIVWDPNGRAWPVSYVGKRGSLSGGWLALSFHNNIEADDICIFELIKARELQLHILRVVQEIKPLLRNNNWKAK